MLDMGRAWEAVGVLHEALSVSPQDPVATDVLGRALEENAAAEARGMGGVDGEGEEAFEALIKREKEALGKKGDGRARRKGRARVSEVAGEDSMMVVSDEEE